MTQTTILKCCALDLKPGANRLCIAVELGRQKATQGLHRQGARPFCPAMNGWTPTNSLNTLTQCLSNHKHRLLVVCQVDIKIGAFLALLGIWTPCESNGFWQIIVFPGISHVGEWKELCFLEKKTRTNVLQMTVFWWTNKQAEVDSLEWHRLVFK